MDSISSTNSSSSCPLPFIAKNSVAGTGGYIAGRYCGASPLDSTIQCCLPCPIQQWIYPSGWIEDLKWSNYLAVASTILCVLLIITILVLPPKSYAILPANAKIATIKHKRYTHIGLLVPILLISLAFLIPLGTDPDLCYDSITPNRIEDDISCAWTSGLLGAGALGATFWVFLKMLYLLILFTKQDKSVNDRPMIRISGIVLGILVPGILLIITLTVTGASYRIGRTCLPNHENSIATLWVWLLIFSGGSLFCFVATTAVIVCRLQKFKRQNSQANARSSWSNIFAFTSRCCRPIPKRTGTPVWLSSQEEITFGGGRLQRGYGGGDGTTPSKQLSPMMLKHYLSVQWRNMVTSIAVVIQAVYFTVVFWSQDSKLGNVSFSTPDREATTRWSECLVQNAGNKDQCLKEASHLTISRNVILGSFILVSICGIEVFMLVFRYRMLEAWASWFRNVNIVGKLNRYYFPRPRKSFGCVEHGPPVPNKDYAQYQSHFSGTSRYSAAGKAVLAVAGEQAPDSARKLVNSHSLATKSRPVTSKQIRIRKSSIGQPRKPTKLVNGAQTDMASIPRRLDLISLHKVYNGNSAMRTKYLRHAAQHRYPQIHQVHSPREHSYNASVHSSSSTTRRTTLNLEKPLPPIPVLARKPVSATIRTPSLMSPISPLSARDRVSSVRDSSQGTIKIGADIRTSNDVDERRFA